MRDFHINDGVYFGYAFIFIRFSMSNPKGILISIEGLSNTSRINRMPVESFAMHNGLFAGKLEEQLQAARKKLFEYREKRIHPHKDDKILMSWNALMIAALARAARVFGNESYLSAGKQALDLSRASLLSTGGLWSVSEMEK